VLDYAPSPSDVATYLSQFGIASTFSYDYESVDGATFPGTDTGSLDEGTLDVETIAGLAPGVRILFYLTPDLSEAALLDAFEQIVTDARANVVNMSFGGCEVPSEQSTVDPIFAQGASLGIAFVAASGDEGDRCYVTSGTQIGVNFPASDPNVIGVGGTETANAVCTGPGTIASQRVFNDFCVRGGGQEAGGGGISGLFPLPAYQDGLGGASATMRNVPDLAMPAVYAAVYAQGGWFAMGGTSWSAPQAAAMIAEVYQWCTAALVPPVQLFYYAFSQAAYRDFVPVTSGNNSFGGDSTFYSATGGFSNVSGIGLPLGMQIAQTLCPNRVPPAALSRAARGALGFARRAPEVATLVSNVPNLRGLADLGRRSDASATRIALVLRSTQTIAQDEQSVIASLTAAGFTVLKTYPNHLLIDAQAPASTVSAFFRTELHDFSQGRYGVRYANVAPAVLPASIAPYVQGVVTDNLVAAFPIGKRRP
jgi:subtilase family serine protease